MKTSQKTFISIFVVLLVIIGIYFLMKNAPQGENNTPTHNDKTVSLQGLLSCADAVGLVAHQDGSLTSQQETTYTSYDVQLAHGMYIPSVIAADVAGMIEPGLCEFNGLYNDAAISSEDKSFLDMIRQDDSKYGYSYFAHLDPIAVEKWGITNFTAQAYQFTGGAHGIGFVQNIILDTQTNQKVENVGLFRADATESIKAMIEQKLTTILGDMMNKEMLQDGLSNPDVLFGLVIPTETGIIFKFQSYDVAPYAAGQPEVVMSFQEIAPFLNDFWKTRLGL